MGFFMFKKIFVSLIFFSSIVNGSQTSIDLNQKNLDQNTKLIEEADAKLLGQIVKHAKETNDAYMRAKEAFLAAQSTPNNNYEQYIKKIQSYIDTISKEIQIAMMNADLARRKAARVSIVHSPFANNVAGQADALVEDSQRWFNQAENLLNQATSEHAKK